MNRLHRYVLAGLVGVLILEYFYIFSFLLNYYFSFMHVENLTTHTWFLMNGKGFHWEDFVRALNIDIVEIDANRITRPISGILQLVDAKFRANLWDIVPPHPSVSLYWPLYFVALPVLLYKFFRNMGCEAGVALAGTSLYLSSLGFLMPIVMLFHPAKSLVNLFATLILFLGSEIYKRSFSLSWRCSVKEVPGFWFYFIGMMVFIFIGFLSDETGLFIYVIVALILWQIFFRFRERLFIIGTFLLPILVYIASLLIFIPRVHLALRGREVNLFHCPMRAGLLDMKWRDIADNFVWLFHDHPHLQLNTGNLLPYNPRLFYVQVIYTLTGCFIIFLFIRTILRNHSSASRLQQIAVCGVLLVLFVFFHTFLLARFNPRAWGIFYYGSLFSLIYYMAVTFIMQFIMEGKSEKLFRKLLVFITFIMVWHGLAFAIYRVNITQGGADHDAYSLEEVFTGKIGPYYQYLTWGDVKRKSQCRRLYTMLVWAKAKQKKLNPPITQEQIDYCQEVSKTDPSFYLDVRYLGVELR